MAAKAIGQKLAGQKLVGEDQQTHRGIVSVSEKRTREEQGGLPKAALRFWSLALCAIALVLGCPALLQAQTSEAIAPLSFTKVFGGTDPLPQVITIASTTLPRTSDSARLL